MSALCELARAALAAKLNGQFQAFHAPSLGRRAACFVTIYDSNHELRGCIGTLEPSAPDLGEEIAFNAVSSGTRDPRFPPVDLSELPSLCFEVSVLAPPESIESPQQLDPRRYGVIVQKGARRGVLLPDLEGVDQVAQQLAIAKRKAGIDEAERVALFRFEVEKHHESRNTP